MIPTHVRDYLRALSDDDSSRVLGEAWDALDAAGTVGDFEAEEAAICAAVAVDMAALARGREQVPF